MVDSYAIKQWSGQWYVLGIDNGMMKAFGLDRIDDLEVKERRVVEEGGIDIEWKFKYSYGIYSAEEYPIEDVVIACDAEDGQYLESNPLHWSQTVVEHSDDETVISFRVRLTPDFIMAIVSRSWSVLVVQPESLRLRLCEIYQKALERNSK